MMVYLLTLFLSPFCLYLSVKSEKRIAIVLRVVAIAIPCMVAGARADTVGTDTALYGGPGFISASESNWLEYYDAFSGWHPLGYCAYTWMVAQLFNNRFIFLASIQLLAVVPIYCTVRQYGRGFEWLGMLVYLLLLFPTSLNAMKQSIAFGFGSLAIVEAWRGRKVRYLSFVAFALLFHPTAIVLLFAYPTALVFRSSNIVCRGKQPLYMGRHFDSNKTSRCTGSDKQPKIMLIYVLGFIGLFVGVSAIGKSLIPFLAEMRESFSFAASHMGEGQFNESSLLLLIISFAVFLYDLFFPQREEGRWSFSDRLRPGAHMRSYFFCVFTIGCLAAQLDVVALSLSRFSYYGFAIAPVFISSFAKEKMNGLDVRNKPRMHYGWAAWYSANAYKCFVALFILAHIAYFLFVFVVRGTAEIYPYRFY